MQEKVQIRAELLVWARKRAGLQIGELREKFAEIEAWEQGEDMPTLRQLESFADKVHVPIGYLFLDNPPAEPMPIQDFRTFGSHKQRSISLNARDMIYLCQRRQDWYRDYAIANGMDKINFAGSKNLNDESAEAAAELRKILQLSVDEQASVQNSGGFLRILREKAEAAGLLVMISGIVGGNTHRSLNIREFRGFALADAYAPLIFVNGQDSDAGKIFTLAHELAHICLGQTGISASEQQNETEQWCNAFAAEFLVPLAALSRISAHNKKNVSIDALFRYFKVSAIVAAQRLRDAGLISAADYEQRWSCYAARQEEQQRQAERQKKAESKGGNYYATLPVRASRRFLRALSASAAEGQTLYRDALRLAGVKSVEKFEKLAVEIKAA